MNSRELLRRLSEGNLENIAFGDLQRLLDDLGFERRRQRGSHLVYVHPASARHLHLQQRRREAKAYQLRQLIAIIREYHLELRTDA